MTLPANVGKYQIIGRLGGGSFADVYHALDRALQTEKAIKILKTTDPGTFLASLSEAQVLAGCVHKHIVQINEANIFPVDGELRVVLDLEYVPEGSLDNAIASRWLSLREAVMCVRGALLGLEHAHSKGFLHRDIKPGNILLAPNCPKLSDFGLATQPGAAVYGSGRGYMTHLAPEYFADNLTSKQTDVYAAGITLFRAICNISDWRAVVAAIPDSQLHVERGTLVRTIGYAPHVPIALQKIVSKACTADPHRRFESAAAFGQKLDSLRFNIDWVRLSDAEWEGTSGTMRFSARVDSRRARLVIKKNGRRMSSECRECGSLADAVAALQQHIAETSLA